MTFAVAYWILMLLVLVGGVVVQWPHRANWRVTGPSLLVFLILLVIGWAVFGAPLK